MRLVHLVCPISQVKIDSNVSRLTTFIVSILIALYVYTRLPYYMILVAVDFFIRSFWNPQYSPLWWLVSKFVGLFRLSERKIDLAPKIFAFRLGLLCAAVSAILFYLQQPAASIIVAIVLLFFAILDAVFNLCVGTLMYRHIVFPFYKGKLSS